MKWLYIMLIVFVSCKNENTQTNKNEPNNLIKMNRVKEYGIRNSFLHPSEITFNDIVIAIDYQNGVSGAEVLNQYILRNVEQKVKIKVYHMFSERGRFFDDISSLNEDLAIHQYYTDGSDIFDMKIIKKLDFPKIETPVPFIEYEWKFEAELPFELEGWKNSRDLTKWDDKEMEDKVVAKFNELKNILNSGNGAAFVKELEFANEEYFIVNYFTESQKEEYISNLIEQYGEFKGLVSSIENYKMRIMGDGKVVTLERFEKYRGQGILTSENKESGDLYLIYTMLHIPQGKESFEIVRINSQITSLNE